MAEKGGVVDKRNRAMYDERARIIKALSHPARLLIVDRLSEGPRCVCEIRGWVGSDMSTVSKHLAVLRNAGIVSDEKRGLQVFYSLRCTCVNQFLACAEQVYRTTTHDRMRLMEAG